MQDWQGLVIRRNRVNFGRDKFTGYGNAPIIDALTDGRPIQIYGVAAIQPRHLPPQVLQYASILQEEYNKEHGIVPQTIKKNIRDTIKASIVEEAQEEYNIDKEADIQEVIDKLTDEMLKYASQMEFEKAAELRDKIKELEKLDGI